MSAANLKRKEKGIIKEITATNVQRQRLMDLGFMPKQEITCQTRVFGTYAFKVMGSLYGIRKELAEQIILK